MQLKKGLVALSLSAGLVGGGLAGAVIGAPGLSGAQESGSTTTVPSQDPAPDDADRDGRPRMEERLGEVLAPLVEDGTITQAQADKVVEALVAAAPERGPGGGGPGHHGRTGRGLDAAAEALGMEADELAQQLRDGRTLAQVAEERGVPVQTVIDALVAEVAEHLDEAVADGRLTREQADERLAEATERITDRVNNGRPEGEGRPGPDGDHDRRGPDGRGPGSRGPGSGGEAPGGGGTQGD
jgi:polyhydroxyalkanoate synthesis regulator phasin